MNIQHSKKETFVSLFVDKISSLVKLSNEILFYQSVNNQTHQNTTFQDVEYFCQISILAII